MLYLVLNRCWLGCLFSGIQKKRKKTR